MHQIPRLRFPARHALAIALLTALSSGVQAAGPTADDAAAAATAAAETAAAQAAPAANQAPTTGARDPVHQLEVVKVTGVPHAEGADDIVAPVSVLTGAELDRRKAATLGETVSSVPGVTTTWFGAGAGRPVIRGLDGPRVSVVSGGLGADDVSTVSQDHAVTIEPFLADQIEVLKGPGTLLYGSGAIGGVVNVVDGRIRESALDRPVQGRAELRHDGVSDGHTAMGRVDAGGATYALHADAVGRWNDDYAIPGGTLANSAVETRTGALAGSVFGDWGFAGLSVSRYLSDYGNPAEPGDDEEPPVTLRMAQSRVEFKAGLERPEDIITGLRLGASHTDYGHTEFEGDEVGTRFSNRANQLRVEATHRELGLWRGAFGLQAAGRRFEAIGEEAFVPGARTRSLGLFVVEQAEWDRFKFEAGLRRERQSVEADTGARRDFRLGSASAGARWKFADGWHVSLNLDRAQRAPSEQELFAFGPHIASSTFEIGDAALGIETSRQAEIGLHVHAARFEAEASLYRNRFDDYILLANTGLVDADSGLPIREWRQQDATFTGVEAEATLHLVDDARRSLDLRLFGDRVRATGADGMPLPRIPPARLGAELRWESGPWRASLGATRNGAQKRPAPLEVSSAGYTLVEASLDYVVDAADGTRWEAFLQGRNLGDALARPATSIIKDAVPLPGLGISVGLRAFF
jgi:iron complex outermembrane receptor protein